MNRLMFIRIEKYNYTKLFEDFRHDAYFLLKYYFCSSIPITTLVLPSLTSGLIPTVIKKSPL